MNIWFLSDPHFSHANIIKFKDDKGIPIRPGFEDIKQHDETIIENYNKVVKPGDHVYFNGDVFWGGRESILPIIIRLPGTKRLVLGNHDEVKAHKLYEHFGKIVLWRIFSEYDFVLSHIPLMKENFPGRVNFNVHGHIHHNPDPSPWHMNICVEKTSMAPIALETITAELTRRKLTDEHPERD